MMRNNVIWMMGGSGSGKTTTSEIFAELGFTVIDADKISRDILKKGKPAYFEVLKSFGTEYLTADGEIDRRKLGKTVFSDKEKLALLNKITHKYIRKEINSQIEKSNTPVLIDAALPPNKFCECDRVVCITAPVSVRIDRIMQRDNISKKAAQDRISSQLTDGEYSEISDVSFENTGDLQELKEKITKWCLDEKII